MTNAPPEWSGKVVHATLEIGDTRLQGADPAPGSYQAPRGFGITLNPAEEDAERLFEGLAEGGAIHVPPGKTYWSAYFGVVTDRFGIPWIVNCEKAG